MSKVSLDKFLALAERSGLVEPERLTAAAHDWKRQASLAQLDDARYCAEALVDAGLFTHWQAKKLLDGRHRGFFLGKYKLLDHLGSGGMSSVYLAEHTLMHRLAAVKVLPQHRVSDSSYLARFYLEGQCAAVLDHPNIVRVYDLDSEGRFHYLVMEYIDGCDLQALVAQLGPLDVHAAADYAAQAAAGLDHAHRAGLVHRDVKPANLLVDRQGMVKILDMGLAKFSAARDPGADLARDDQVLGTADYVAPEQAVNSNAVDQRADIYSLGCSLYFLLTGHPPFATGSPTERMIAHQRRTPPSLATERPDAPAELAAICERMMQKSPAARQQTAAEVRQQLVAWLESETAAGRIQPSAHVAIASQRPDSGPFGSHPESAVHVVTGSTPELDRSPPPISAALTDTDSILHGATQKMPAAVGLGVDPAHWHSHVLHQELARLNKSDDRAAGISPPPPPIAIPPAPPAAVVAPPQVRVAPAPAPRGSSSQLEAPIVRTSTRASHAVVRQRAGARWLAVLLLSGLAFTAVALAVFALAS